MGFCSWISCWSAGNGNPITSGKQSIIDRPWKSDYCYFNLQWKRMDTGIEYNRGCTVLSNVSNLLETVKKIPWIEEPGRLQSMGSLRVGHNWATSFSLFTFMHWRRKMATHSNVLAWRIPGTGEPGRRPSMGSHRVGHDWSNLAAAGMLVAASLVIKEGKDRFREANH